MKRDSISNAGILSYCLNNEGKNTNESRTVTVAVETFARSLIGIYFYIAILCSHQKIINSIEMVSAALIMVTLNIQKDQQCQQQIIP